MARGLGKRTAALYNEVCDVCGAYSVFACRDAVRWLAPIPAQDVRNALEGLVRQGALERIHRGVYKWRSPR